MYTYRVYDFLVVGGGGGGEGALGTTGEWVSVLSLQSYGGDGPVLQLQVLYQAAGRTLFTEVAVSTCSVSVLS